MDNYDVIVVGAGNSGLVSALYLLKKGYKVLLLEQQNKIGGLNQTMIKGRFEFDMSLFNYFIDSKKEDYSIKNIFEELGIESNLEFSKIPEAFRVITREGGDIPARDITMPIGIENFISKMEQIVKDSETAVRTFFELALECKEALEYIMNTNEIDYDYIKENYNNFMRVAPYSLSKVLDIIDMPLEAQEILNTYWIYLGSPETEITFAQYAAFVYDAVNYGILIPNTKNYGIAADIANEYLISGGELKLNSPVVKLLVDDNKLNLKVATRLLEKYNIETDTCQSGMECIEKINNKEKYNLILMDDMMPKMTGTETLQKLKEIKNYSIPTIALTANAISGMREKYVKAGFDDYLSKPIDKLELNRIINDFLNK